MHVESEKTNWGQFIPLVIVFFFWGFVAASNDILIPVFKQTFNLSQGESQLVSLAFYIAYTVGSLIYMGISLLIKQDLVNKIGYKNGLALGLLISALGTLLFYPAANLGSFQLMLSGLFIVALGFSLQQTVANPLAIALGPIETGSQRLTLAGGINNLGTTIGPLIVSFAIFGSASNASSSMSIESVKIPYLVLGLAFLLVAILLKFSSLPDRPKYMEKNLGFLTKDIAPYISLYWASLMIGRWTGAVEAFTDNMSTQKILRFIAPYIAFAVFLFVNAVANHDLSPFYIYALIILVLIAADIASKGNPARMLLIFSGLGIVALLVGMTSSGMTSVYAFTSVGLFCSTLWPCIFTLAISGLGKHTSQGSSFLIMMIMGGGIVSWLQGFVADEINNIQYSYIVGVLCFAYLAFYAWKVSGILKSQGINFDKKLSGGH